MQRGNLRHLAVTTLVFFVLARLSHANVFLNLEGAETPARSKDDESPPIQLLKLSDNVERSHPISLIKITPRGRRIRREGLHPPGPSSHNAPSAAVFEHAIESDSFMAASPLSTRSNNTLSLRSTFHPIVQLFQAVFDPQTALHFIEFWSQVISAAANYYGHLDPVEAIEFKYGQVKLRLQAKHDDTIPWIFVKAFAGFFLDLARAGWYGFFYLVYYGPPFVIAAMLFGDPGPNMVTNWAG